MKGAAPIIEVLNRMLTIELTAINQYFVQSKMCKNWGYRKLAKKHWDEAMEEMRHADKLIERILFLEGIPNISRYDVIRVGETVPKHFENDLALERDGVAVYNEGISLCVEKKDAGSRELMEHILQESENHVDWLESQIHMVEEVGLPNYLSEQIGAPS